MTDIPKTTDTMVYVIDENFRIVYYSNELKRLVPEVELNRPCYEIFSGRHSQCRSCPLRSENHGTTIRYNARLDDWFNVHSASFEFPGLNSANIIMIHALDKHGNRFVHNPTDASDYDELLELNYCDDIFRIAYHGKRELPEENLQGGIRTMVEEVAKRRIHPDDIERFYEFWQLDHVGKQGIPDKLLTSRHGEFRRLDNNGTYQWVQQLMIPVRQSTKNSMFVNSFFNIIDMPVSLDDSTDEPEEHKLFDRKYFFKYVDELLRHRDDGREWFMLSIDLEKFKLFNEWYGKKAGDKLLAALSRYLKNLQETEGGIAGYFDNDDFALFASYDREHQEKIYEEIAALLKLHSDKMNILPAFGMYRITDRSVPAFKAYDRANLACSAVKGNYATRMKEFDSAMLQQLESEYLLLSDIQAAFENKEFTFYLQPKCDMKTGQIVGAEALARWISKDKGMVSPGVFIPFLEKNGFVAALDTLIWEEVCKWQRSMLDRGRQIRPVSVNVSRTDLYSVDVPAYFNDLIKKYNLSPNLIEIEITESAYAENDNLVAKTVDQLRASGFHILMDDFGSAYSSLNMLKDISVDTLKIDMRFLGFTENNTSRGIDILETVCNMANILGLGIIVEGVETEEQKNYLLKMKCNYGQGFYFYRPLPIDDFENLVEKEGVLRTETPEHTDLEMFYLKDLLGKDIFSEVMINNMLGAVVFYDVCDGQITIIRYNEQYAALLGNKNYVRNTKVRFGDQLYEEDIPKVFKMFEKAQQNRHKGAEIDLRRRTYNGSDIWLHLKTFFLHRQNGHDIFYSSASNVTKMYRANEALRFLNNDMPGGYYRHQNNEDYDFTVISQRFLEITGYTRKEVRELFDNKLINMIHPDDRETAKAAVRTAKDVSGTISMTYRIQTKNGYVSVVVQSRLVKYDGHEIFQGIILRDIDKLFQNNTN